MSIWSDSYLTQLIHDAEEDISLRVNCLFRRTSFTITVGNALYDLPAGITDMLQISWLGKVLQPLTNYVLMRSDPTYMTNQSTPLYYSSDADGAGVLRFYPVPNVAVAQVANPYNLNGIQNGVCISYFMTAQQGTTLTIPAWISKRLIKLYVLYRAFAKEGKGQRLDLSVYYFKRYEKVINHFKVLNALPQMSRRRPNRDRTLGFQLAKPVYPANYGTDRYLDGRDY